MSCGQPDVTESIDQPDYPITRLPNVTGDRRPIARVGREARLELRFERRHGRTVIAHAYAEPPLRVGASFEVDGAASLILVCSGPGVFAGDALRQSVHVARGARVVLTTQSALQVHPSPAMAAARIDHEYCVDEDGELHCHWDPVIPFAGARLAQRYDIRVAGGARLYWSDALMSGRVTRGESWQCRDLAHELGLRANDRLVYLERYRIGAEPDRVRRAWVAGGVDYLATALVWHEGASREAADRLQEAVAACDQVKAGIDLVDDRFIVARLAASSGVPFSAARRLVRTLALTSTFGRQPVLDRK
jgi:urease accessory protein